MALVLGTNCGFVVAAPVTDPNEAAPAIDGFAVALEDTTHVTATTVTEIGWWCDSQGDEGQNFEVGIYDDDADSPDNLIGSDITNVLSAGAGWKSVVGLNISVSPETKYWLGLQVDASSAATDYNFSGEGEGQYYFGAASALPDPWVSATSTTRINSLYAVWTAGANLAPSVNDSLALTEDVTVKISPYKAAPNDAIGLTEDVTARITPLKASVFDSIGLTDVVTARFNFYKASVFDSIGLTDVTAAELISAVVLQAIAFDSIGLVDISEPHVTPLKADAFDTISLTDISDARITPLKALVFDNIDLLDNAAIPLGVLEAIVFDTIALTDAPISEVLTFLQNIVSGEIEQFPQFRGNLQAWNVEIAKYVEKHLRQLKQDIETLYTKV